MDSDYHSFKCHVPTKLDFCYLNWFFIDSLEEAKTDLEGSNKINFILDLSYNEVF